MFISPRHNGSNSLFPGMVFSAVDHAVRGSQRLRLVTICSPSNNGRVDVIPTDFLESRSQSFPTMDHVADWVRSKTQPDLATNIKTSSLRLFMGILDPGDYSRLCNAVREGLSPSDLGKTHIRTKNGEFTIGPGDLIAFDNDRSGIVISEAPVLRLLREVRLLVTRGWADLTAVAEHPVTNLRLKVISTERIDAVRGNPPNVREILAKGCQSVGPGVLVPD